VNISDYGLVDLIMRPASVSSHLGLRDALFPGLYTDNASAPLQAGAGLRRAYGFGLYSYCAYVNETAGLCSAKTIPYQSQPYAVIANDIPPNYSNYTNTILHGSAFADSSLSARSSREAFYFLLFGFIMSIISLILYVGFVQRSCGLSSFPPSEPCHSIPGQIWVFLVSSVAGILAAVLSLTGSAIWGAILKKAKDDNPSKVQPAQLPLGIKVSHGGGLALAWMASGFLAVGSIPIVIESVSFFRLIPTTPAPG